MKMIVETVGPYMLLGSTMNGSDAVEHNRPCVVVATTYIQLKAAAGVVKILKQDLPDEANDADFAGFWAECEGDVDLAVESYVSSFEPKPAKAPKAPKPDLAPEPAPAAE